MLTLPHNRALLGRPAAAWTPLALPGLVGWWRADSGLWQDSAGTTPAVADGDPVGRWTDLSGAGTHLTQATASKRPTLKLSMVNGQPVVRCDGVDDWLQSAAFTLNQPVTAYLVYQSRTIGANGVNDIIADLGNTSELSYAVKNTPQTILYAGTQLVYGAAVANATFAVLSLLFNTTTSKMWENGTQRASGTIGANNGGKVTLGALRTGTRPTAIDVAEGVLYTGAQADSDRGRVQQYLGARYGLAVS